jgi:exodeoxyribonuclease VII small subunit
MSELSFEAAICRLDEITKLLESGDLSLDESMKLFEEGTKLADFCNKQLDAAELKIVQVQKSGEKNDAE